MTTAIAGLPFWQLTFDADGNADSASGDPLIEDVKSKGLTDLVVFAHGWNNDQGTAMRLYQGFFSLLAGQLSGAPAGTVVGLAGVLWPSELWPDEPPPDFGPAAALPVDSVARAWSRRQTTGARTRLRSGHSGPPARSCSRRPGRKWMRLRRC